MGSTAAADQELVTSRTLVPFPRSEICLPRHAEDEPGVIFLHIPVQNLCQDI